jgi:phenylpyruvate tautomerase PptA (4-oxalocrotonate tautomerase family)
MPILEIEIVLRPGEALAVGLAARLADAAAGVLRSPPRSTWVRLRELAANHFAENGAGPEAGAFPVFVSVLKRENIAGQLPEEAERLAGVVAGLCDRPRENVHVLFEPKGGGRVAFGGKLLQSQN